jgi:hypothetical protein
MPLLDHFRPPLSLRRHWHAFHNAWATYISSDFNRQLPEGFFAEANVQFGIEIDVAMFREAGDFKGANDWTPPEPTATVSFATLTDIIEVRVFSTEAGPVLIGAVELVSPANKDRPEHRDALVSKCAAYLQQGVGLLLVDVVTDRKANMHRELLQRLAADGEAVPVGELYAVSYRPVEREKKTQLDMWGQSLAIGEELPALPLWLKGGICLRVDLEATYERTCQEQRVIAAGKDNGKGE